MSLPNPKKGVWVNNKGELDPGARRWQLRLKDRVDSTLRVVTPPSSETDTGTAGDVAYDSTYFYVCHSANLWGRYARSW